MKRSIYKPILFGVLIGTAAFFVPFLLLKVMLFFLIIGFICKLFWRRRGGWHHGYHNIAFADKLRGMTDEQYAEFKNKFNDDCCGYGYNHGCCDNSGSEKCETKTENKEQSSEKK